MLLTHALRAYGLLPYPLDFWSVFEGCLSSTASFNQELPRCEVFNDLWLLLAAYGTPERAFIPSEHISRVGPYQVSDALIWLQGTTRSGIGLADYHTGFHGRHLVFNRADNSGVLARLIFDPRWCRSYAETFRLLDDGPHTVLMNAIKDVLVRR